MKLFILYFRVSTKAQGESGLGLEAQRTMVERFLSAESTVVAEFTEIESGKNSKRPQLAAALKLARDTGATLVVAKLDRLARNVAFTSALMESGVEFVACDCPHASKLTIHILAAVAEDEAKRISQRTTAALAELKKAGVKLGGANPVIAEKIRGRSGWNFQSEEKKLRVLAERIQASYGAVIPMIRLLLGRGETPSQIAAALNQSGYTTPRGSKWIPSSVSRLIPRIAA